MTERTFIAKHTIETVARLQAASERHDIAEAVHQCARLAKALGDDDSATLLEQAAPKVRGIFRMLTTTVPELPPGL